MEYRDSIRRKREHLSSQIILAAAADFNSPRGWFRQMKMWRIRTTVDLLLKGQTPVPKRHSEKEDPFRRPAALWEIEQTGNPNRLTLRSLMKLPGEGRLELEVAAEIVELSLVFRPQKAWGRLYWIITHPCHPPILNRTLKHILKEARHRQFKDSPQNSPREPIK